MLVVGSIWSQALFDKAASCKYRETEGDRPSVLISGRFLRAI